MEVGILVAGLGFMLLGICIACPPRIEGKKPVRQESILDTERW